MGNPIIATRAPGVRVVASASTWIEGEALRQLDAAGALPGIARDGRHAGPPPGQERPGRRGLPLGGSDPASAGRLGTSAAAWALWQTDLSLRRADPARIAGRLDGLDGPWEGDASGWLAARGLPATAHDASLGTVGHGNHFLEVQAVAEIRDPEAAARIGVAADRALLLVHTGSRGLGEAVLRAHAERYGATPLRAETPEADAYMSAHDGAVAWAKVNRDLVAQRALVALNAEGHPLLDVCHNAVTPVEAGGCRCLLHRKGAASLRPRAGGGAGLARRRQRPRRAGAGPGRCAVVAGARGGRKLARHEAKAKLKGRLRREDLAPQPFRRRGGLRRRAAAVGGGARRLQAGGLRRRRLGAAGLVRVVAVLRPLVTFSAPSIRTGRLGPNKRDRMRERRAARSVKYGER